MIVKVNGKPCPCPSVCEFGWADISKSNAGRDQRGKMHTLKIARKVTMKLAWNGVSREKCAQVLALFNAETFKVEYYDPAKAKGTTTKTFYRGDVSAPVKWWYTGKEILESVSFDIIEV